MTHRPTATGEGRRTPTARRAVVWLMSAVALAMPLVAGAQIFEDIAPNRPIRLEGYWEHPRSDPKVLGEITISADGHARRSFGVTSLQAYKPPEEGVQVLRHSGLQPITLLLRGRDKMVQRFVQAGPDEKVVAYGVYRAASATLTLDSVETSAGL